MHGLETIKALNAPRLKEQGRPRPVDNGQWKVNDSEGLVVAESNDKIYLVDVRDPQNDKELVEFHKRKDVPKSVQRQVEHIASQRRRMICVAA